MIGLKWLISNESLILSNIITFNQTVNFWIGTTGLEQRQIESRNSSNTQMIHFDESFLSKIKLWVNQSNYNLLTN